MAFRSSSFSEKKSKSTESRCPSHRLVFAAQVRKENNVADTWAVGQQHDQAVDAYAAAAGRRHAVFQRPDVVGVVVHGLFVAGIFGVDLSQEARRSEEHTSELQSLMRISYAVFCLKK